MGVLLSKNPVQGGSVVVRLTFKDESGLMYVPVEGSVFFALLASKKDGLLWSVVRPWTSLSSASVVDIVLQGADLELLSECTLKRRVIVEWKYLRGGEVTVGLETVDFEVVPLPVADPPLEPLPA